MRPYLIITVDYEVFGNGTGQVTNCVTAPAQRIMQLGEEFGASITFFVEALEFIAMEKYGLNGAKQVSQQLRKAALNAHDIQLHLHPQWEKPTLGKDGSWHLNMERWRIGDLSFAESMRLVKIGKEWLENLITPVLPEYKCIAFRAGGWCIQPSTAIVQALKNLDFQIDSTVAPGVRNIAGGEWSDFRHVPKKPYWRTENDVCAETSSGIWELPITTGTVSKWAHINAIKAARSINNGFPPGCLGNYKGPNTKFQALQGKFGKILQLGHVMLDISTMPAELLIAVTKQWVRRFPENALPIPIVAIAHTKNFTQLSMENMKRYLTWAKGEKIVFSTYRKFLEEVNVSA